MSSKENQNTSKQAMNQEEQFRAYLDVEELGGAKKFSVGTLRKLYLMSLRYKWLMILGLTLSAATTLATLAGPRLVGWIIDDAIVPKDLEKLEFFGWIFFGVVVFRIVTLIGEEYTFNAVGQYLMQDVRQKLVRHLQRLPLSTYDRIPAGKIVTRITNDVSSLAEMFTAGFISIIGNIAYIFGSIAFLIYLDWKMGILVSAAMPVLVLASIRFSRMLKESYQNARARLSALNAYLAENILGMSAVQLSNRQAQSKEKYSRLSDWFQSSQLQTIRTFALFQPAITLCVGISMGLLIWKGGFYAYDGRIAPGLLVAFFTYTFHMFQPLRDIADKWNFFVSGLASADRIFALLDWAPEKDLSEVVSSVQPADLRGEIRFENVWFAYKGDDWVFKDFNWFVPAGRSVGIVGPTGSGKSTLLSLLMRFYDVQKGRILIDGRDIREYDKRALRAAIGLVQQDVFLFSGAVRENIHIWSHLVDSDTQVRHPNEKDVDERAEGILGELKKGSAAWNMRLDLDRSLQERGGNLSMGQRQLIAFARAQFFDPKIWVLDEATASVDSQTEQELNLLLKKLSKKKTTLMIAHRLATVRDADQIIVLHRGELLERGQHRDLLRERGLYARLYRLQEATSC